jgi:copper chaperone NosL
MTTGKISIRFLITVFLFARLTVTCAIADNIDPPKPSKTDKCPVCGMFVYKYPDWTAEIIFEDGSVFFFDGAKDLFKFYFNLKTYHPRKTYTDISAVYVTEYYDLKLINAQDAVYVIGSDIYGPMGRELIPFASEADAGEFMKDHKGKRVLRFENIKPSVIDKLD